MKLSELKTSEEVLAEDLKDPEFREEWERTAIARAVAVAVVAYRSKHSLSQRALAAVLGIPQPQVARLERGDQNPSLGTLIRLSHRLDIEFALDIHPPGREPKLVTKAACRADALAADEASGDRDRGLVLAVR